MRIALVFFRDVPRRGWFFAVVAFVIFASVVAATFAGPFLLAKSLAELQSNAQTAGIWLALGCFAWTQMAGSFQLFFYVHFEQHLQKAVQRRFFNMALFIPYGQYVSVSPDEYSISLDRGTTGLRHAL